MAAKKAKKSKALFELQVGRTRIVISVAKGAEIPLLLLHDIREALAKGKFNESTAAAVAVSALHDHVT